MKEEFFIVRTEDGIVIFFNELQPENTSFPIVLIDEGIFICFNLSSIEIKVCGSEISDNEEHLQNETEPMDVKEEGIFIFDKAEQPLNEFSLILVIFDEFLNLMQSSIIHL